MMHRYCPGTGKHEACGADCKDCKKLCDIKTCRYWDSERIAYCKKMVDIEICELREAVLGLEKDKQLASHKQAVEEIFKNYPNHERPTNILDTLDIASTLLQQNSGEIGYATALRIDDFIMTLRKIARPGEVDKCKCGGEWDHVYGNKPVQCKDCKAVKKGE